MERVEDEAMGLGEALLALRMVQKELPSNFDSFFAKLDGKSDLELKREICMLAQRAQERKARNQPPQQGGIMSYASNALQSVVPARVQAFVEYAKQDVIRKQLLYDPNAPEQEEEETSDISMQQLAVEVKQAATSGILLNNVLDLSEQVITQHFGTSEVDFTSTSTSERMVGMAKQISFGVRERFPFGVSSLFLPSTTRHDDEEEDLGGVDDWDEDEEVNDNLVD